MRITPTLAALALIGAATGADTPAATAAELAAKATPAPVVAPKVADDKFEIGFKFQLQARAYAWSDAKQGTSSSSMDPLRSITGVVGGEAEPMRFALMRARIGFDLKAGDGWRANITLRGGEDWDRGDLGSGSSTATRVESKYDRYASLYLATGGRKISAGGMDHAIDVGLGKGFTCESITSSNDFAFPQQSPATYPIGLIRNMGIGYVVSNADFAAGVSMRNNSVTVTKDPQTSDATERNPKAGHLWTLRTQFQNSSSGKAPARKESFCAKAGTDIIVGFDVLFDNDGYQDDTNAATYTRRDYWIYGPDLMVHADGLTAIAELKFIRTETELTADGFDGQGRGAKSKVGGLVANVQAAYAAKLDSGMVVEPALRWALVDNDRTSGNYVREYSTYAGPEGATGSAWQTNLGANVYWRGDNSVKTQLAWQHWVAEDGTGRADLVVLQQQFAF